MTFDPLLDHSVLGVVYTRQRVQPGPVMRAVASKIGTRPLIANHLHLYSYLGLRVRQKPTPFTDWSELVETLLMPVYKEPRAVLLLQNHQEGPYVEIDLHLNCSLEVEKERIDGKLRKVPVASNVSGASLSAEGRLFQSSPFTDSYLNVLALKFDALDGVYGRAHHLSVNYMNDMDRASARANLLVPTYVTWCNLFGSELVAQIGRERVLSAPAHRIVELDKGGIMVVACPSPLEERQPESQQQIAAVKAHLGILSPSERATPEERAAFAERAAQAQAAMNQRIAGAFRQRNEETAVEMLRQAEGCVEGVRGFFRVELDYSSASLAAVDRIIQTGFNRNEDEETIATTVQAFGSYVGEVIRRWQGGEWRDIHFSGQPTLINVGAKRREFNPFQAVRTAFEKRHSAPKVTVANLVESIVSS